MQALANLYRELTLAAMAPYAVTRPVAAQAPAALGVKMMSPAPGVDRPRQAGMAWMEMAAAEVKAENNIHRFVEFAFF
jgi:hypothetical protein